VANFVSTPSSLSFPDERAVCPATFISKGNNEQTQLRAARGGIFLSCLVGHAQSTFGSLVGTVQDKSGAIVPGAQVAATNLDTGAMRTVLSSDTGQYELLEMLRPVFTDGGKTGFGVVRIPEISLDAGKSAALMFPWTLQQRAKPFRWKRQPSQLILKRTVSNN